MLWPYPLGANSRTILKSVIFANQCKGLLPIELGMARVKGNSKPKVP